jgi:hypothetical protein
VKRCSKQWENSVEGARNQEFQVVLEAVVMAGIEKVSISQLKSDNWSIWKAKFQALLD